MGKRLGSLIQYHLRGSVNSPHKWPVTRKMFPFDDVIMFLYVCACLVVDIVKVNWISPIYRDFTDDIGIHWWNTITCIIKGDIATLLKRLLEKAFLILDYHKCPRSFVLMRVIIVTTNSYAIVSVAISLCIKRCMISWHVSQIIHILEIYQPNKRCKLFGISGL